MGKMKIHEIAKQIGLTSKEVIAKANELGIEVASHMNSVEDSQAEKIKNSFKKGSNNEAENKEKKEITENRNERQ